MTLTGQIVLFNRKRGLFGLIVPDEYRSIPAAVGKYGNRQLGYSSSRLRAPPLNGSRKQRD